MLSDDYKFGRILRRSQTWGKGRDRGLRTSSGGKFDIYYHEEFIGYNSILHYFINPLLSKRKCII